MTKAINDRELVMLVLLEITRDGQYSHIALRNTLSKYQYLDKKERAFITRVVEGTLEHMIEIDYIINQFSKVKVNKMKPVIRIIIRSAVYQLKYMDSVPNSAVCNEAVKLAVKKGFSSLRGFVNGVLRNIERNLEQVEYPKESELIPYLAIRYSMPEWLIKHFLESYDRDTVERMLADFQTEKPTIIRVNVHQISVESLKGKLEQEGVTVEIHPYLEEALFISDYDYLGDLESFEDGDFQVQDISSMLVTEVAGIKEGDYCIDVCAAPGGKSLHIADKLAGTGHVEARDLTEYKVELIEDNIERSGVENMEAVQQDATELDESSIEKADVVIADLPCSGLGVLGKKTDLKYKVTEQQLRDLVDLQHQMLEVVTQYVKPGGIFMYSTCTINPAENMNQVDWILEHTNFKLADIKQALPEVLQKDVERDGCLQLLPGVHLCDGFFLAKFIRPE